MLTAGHFATSASAAVQAARSESFSSFKNLIDVAAAIEDANDFHAVIGNPVENDMRARER
jgi:hypothetical protein